MIKALLFVPKLIWNVLVRIFLKGYVKLTFQGQLPAEGSFIIVANHTSHLDAPCLFAALPLTKISSTYVAAAKDCFFKSKWKSAFFSFVINAIPFDRYENPASSLSACYERIKGEKNLIFFPEGTRSSTGAIQRFKSGIGVLVAGGDIKVIPAYIEGAYQAWPKACWLPLPHQVKVVFGEALSFENVPRNREGFISVANTLEMKIKEIAEEAR